MHSAPWQLKESVAQLQLGALSALITPSRPIDGLTSVIIRGHHLAAARLLGIAIGRPIENPAASAIENYVRGADMIVAYEDSSRSPVRVDAVWRAVASTAIENDASLAAVDLIVSVRTHLLDMHPDLSVESVVPSSDVFRLSTSHSAACEPLVMTDKASAAIEPESGSGCLLFRLPGVDFSYAEMVHPADFQHDELSRGVTNDGTFRIAHRLFCTSLEKGVILRARVRGVFLDRHDDARAAAACYAAFAAADPPLGT
jgi:hypothetical protein